MKECRAGGSAAPIGVECLEYPNSFTVSWNVQGNSGTIIPYDPVCGNVHFTPNSRSYYDLFNGDFVVTTCQGFGLGGGQGGTDVLEPFNSALFGIYNNVARDCMGPFLVYWMQNFPGLDTNAVDPYGRPILNWWPYLYY